MHLLGRRHDVLHPVDDAQAQVVVVPFPLVLGPGARRTEPLQLGEREPLALQQEYLLDVVQRHWLPHQPATVVVDVQAEPGLCGGPRRAGVGAGPPGGRVHAVERVLVLVAAPDGGRRVVRHH